MHKKLIRYDRWHFSEPDPVRLKRTAIKLREQILAKVEATSDRYGFYQKTMPVLDAAIKGEILETLDEDEDDFIPANFTHDQMEGLLPAELDREFTKAIADFSVTVQGLSLERTDKITQDGVTYGWVDFEDEGDWPHNVKFP